LALQISLKINILNFVCKNIDKEICGGSIFEGFEDLYTLRSNFSFIFGKAWLAGKYAIDAVEITIDENKLWNCEDFRK